MTPHDLQLLASGQVLCLCEVGMCLHVLCFMLLCVHCCRWCVLSHLFKV